MRRKEGLHVIRTFSNQPPIIQKSIIYLEKTGFKEHVFRSKHRWISGSSPAPK